MFQNSCGTVFFLINAFGMISVPGLLVEKNVQICKQIWIFLVRFCEQESVVFMLNNHDAFLTIMTFFQLSLPI